MGEAPVTVSAVGSCLVDPEIGKAGDFDTAAVTLTYADGRITTIRNTRRAGYGDQRVEVQGSQGMLQVGNLVENLLIKSTAAGVTKAKPVLFFLERYLPAYRAEWSAFISALTGGPPVPVTLADGVLALAMAEAATQSAKTGLPVLLADI
jgi:myo-inositol 2-dehydrogenase/D-chiro-inositol 1-dehydrogenase